MYPEAMGKSIRANDPAVANHPSNAPWGRRPTTVCGSRGKAGGETRRGVRVSRNINRLVSETLLHVNTFDVLLENNPMTAVCPMGYPMA